MSRSGEMVGAARFELATPSLPDTSLRWKTRQRGENRIPMTLQIIQFPG